MKLEKLFGVAICEQKLPINVVIEKFVFGDASLSLTRMYHIIF